MATPRSYLLNLADPGWVHCVSRCVRKAFLAGNGFAHRKQWVEDRLQALAGIFACEVAAYAVMSNHLHVVVRMRPDLAKALTPEQLAVRWLTLFPGRGNTLADGTITAPTEGALRAFANDPERVDKARARLGDLTWFMKALKEGIARRANREDDCTGAFWEARYTSVPLLDQHALLSCMAYVDLNPIRAKMADRPERSPHTSGRLRSLARKRRRVAVRVAALPASDQARVITAAGITDPQQTATDPERDHWLQPVQDCRVTRLAVDVTDPKQRRGYLILNLDEYLTLVDATGRLLVEGKRGRIPPGLPEILQRLDLSVDAWLATMSGGGQMLGGAVGTVTSREDEAVRRGVRWVRSTCAMFTRKQQAA